MRTQGQIANDTGDKLENRVRGNLIAHKLQYTPQYKICDFGPLGETVKTDFYIWDKQMKGFSDGLCIECKFQAVSGSAEQKISYTHELIKDYYELPAIVVLSGEHSVRMYEYMKKRVGGNLKAALRPEELYDWLAPRIRATGHNGYLPF